MDRGATLTASARLGPSSESPGQARAFVAAVLSGWGAESVVDLARLLVSELVTNAVFHAGTPVDLRVERRGAAIRVEVEDGRSGTPERLRAPPWSVTGRGLLLVDELAEAWGVERLPVGKVVWFELVV